VPASPGLKVDAGTVWSKSLETDSSSRARKFVHVGDTAVCTIDDDLGRDPAVTEAGQAALIESLNVQWSR
jgi:hypothetical protein